MAFKRVFIFIRILVKTASVTRMTLVIPWLFWKCNSIDGQTRVGCHVNDAVETYGNHISWGHDKL
jgi:hypothetical protein